jgi:predicted DNA-binding protein
MKDHRITVRLSHETRSRLRAVARRSGKRESDLIRNAIELKLAAEEAALTAYDHARNAGIIGVGKGTIRDLSTNSEHLEGSGRT